MRLYFDSVDLDRDIYAINVYVAPSRSSEFAILIQEPFDPSKDWVEVPDTESLNWFKISVVDSDGGESALSEPFVGTQYLRVIEEVRSSLGDTNLDDPAFTDDEYMLKIKEAVKIHYKSDDVFIFKDSDVSFLIMLVMENCCYSLAYDAARYTKITLPDSISLNKGERVAHYLSIARALRSRYEALTKTVATGDGSYYIKKIRHNYFTPRRRRL